MQPTDSAQPTVSAAIIARDDRSRLAACLASLAGFVDEVVVCDTGSTDDTVSFARDHGAYLVEAPWIDDFSAARNRVLDACIGDWVLSIDTDEVVLGTPTWLRPMLAVCNEEGAVVDALEVVISNERSDGSAPQQHREIKLFRRGGVRWSGRVHERLERTDGRELVVASMPPETLRVSHAGYADPDEARRKADRNAALARLEVTDQRDRGASDAALARALLDLGRSTYACGALDEAVAALREARERSSDPLTWRWSTDFLIKVELLRSRPDEAEALLDEAVTSGMSAGYCKVLRAQVCLMRDDIVGARELLDDVSDAVDLNGSPLNATAIAALRATLVDPAR